MSDLEFYRNPKYFHPSRTQPFLITFFQAVMAFKKVCKLIKIRIGRTRQFNLLKRSTTFQVELKRSQQQITMIKKGQSLIQADVLKPHLLITATKVGDDFYKNQEIRYNKREKLFTQVNKQINGYLSKERQNPVSQLLDHKLTKLAEEGSSPSKKTRATILGKSNNDQLLSHSNVFQAFENTQQTNHNNNNETNETTIPSSSAAPFGEGEEGGTGPKREDYGDYIEGTAIYYGSTVAIQAKHGGYLSFNNNEIKASAHKVLTNSKFIVKKSDDLTDIGIIKYGDALWLQAGLGFVLGAQYGSLIDQKREIQPTLVSCKRQSMFKAQQYGRWIVLNKENPMRTLGKPVCHYDKIMLEQEWYFLASLSPYQSSMFKSISNSDEAMVNNKINLFEPIEECTWKLHLIALPSDDRDDLKQRQQLLQEAKDQIIISQEMRYTKSPFLLGSLSSATKAELNDTNVVHRLLQHKVTPQLEQEYFLKKFKELEKAGFQRSTSSPALLQKIYGKDSSIATLYEKIIKQRKINEQLYYDNDDSDHEKNAHHHHENDRNHAIEVSENEYYDAVQRIMINTESWMELGNVMNEFQYRDDEKKVKAATKLQGFLKKNIEKRFNFPRAMKKVDRITREKLENKDQVKRQILLENMRAMGLDVSGVNGSGGGSGGLNGFGGHHHNHQYQHMIHHHSSQLSPSHISPSASPPPPSSSSHQQGQAANRADVSSQGKIHHIPSLSSTSPTASPVAVGALPFFTTEGRLSPSVGMNASGIRSNRPATATVSRVVHSQYQYQQQHRPLSSRKNAGSYSMDTENDMYQQKQLQQQHQQQQQYAEENHHHHKLAVTLTKSFSKNTKDFFKKQNSLPTMRDSIAFLSQSVDYEQQQQQQHQQSCLRPQSASILTSSRHRQQQHHDYHEKEKKERDKVKYETEQMMTRLMNSSDKEYALPLDVFEDIKETNNLKIGIKFLKAMKSERFDDVKLRKRKSNKNRS
jgi:hypothetical protein